VHATLPQFLAASMRIIAQAPDEQEAARRIAAMGPLGGQLASSADRRRSVAAQIPVRQWPRQRLLIAAVDAEFGRRVGLLGGVSARVPFWLTVLAQGASSFVNRVSPSNVGGTALNVRFLQKAGIEPAAGVAAVGVNSLAGPLVHAVLLVIFFAWAGRSPGKAFKLPSSSTLLVILGVAAAVIGIVIATRQGRQFAARKLLPSLRSSLASLRRWRGARPS
jgi:Lysylphosphatidylglycerol synthase TM region